MTLSMITSLEIRKLRQVMNIFKVLIFAVDSLAVICANTRPCRFNKKNERTVQCARRAIVGCRRKQTKKPIAGRQWGQAALAENAGENTSRGASSGASQSKSPTYKYSWPRQAAVSQT